MSSAMSEEHTTAVVQRYLDELAQDSPAEPIGLPLLPVRQGPGGVPSGAFRPGNLHDARRRIPRAPTQPPPRPRHSPAPKWTGGGSPENTRGGRPVLRLEGES